MLKFLVHRWFLWSLVAVLVAGITWPAAMRSLVGWLPGDLVVAVVTFIMALPLETGALWKAVRRPGPAWLAALINSGLAPPLGWLASRVLPAELAMGVVVATTVPCTLATAAVWTRRAGGNDAVAFLVTMITNLSCFIIVPTWLWVLLGVRAEIDFTKVAVGLAGLVVLPIIVAQLLRQWRAIGESATHHKHLLSFLAQLGVLLVVAVGAVKCGERVASAETDSPLATSAIMLMIGCVMAVHTVLLAVGFFLARAARFDFRDGIAVAFSGSQKTLMVGAFLAAAIGPLAILPMVAYHAAQLVIDTLVADWLRARAAENDAAMPDALSSAVMTDA
jgi:sodium/bile acid cotransporter 7